MSPSPIFQGLRPIDCDLHPMVPSMRALTPYMDEFWADQVVERNITTLDSQSWPIKAPKTIRADWRGPNGRGAETVEQLRTQVLDRFGVETGILNPLYGVQLVLNADMAVAFTRALNDWIRAEWLDKDDRLRASIVLPLQSIEASLAEIERLAPDRRFVQVLALVMGEDPLGKRQYWPIYEACERHGLTFGIHAGSAYRHPQTSVGWTSWYLEEYAANQQGFQSQLASLVTEGALVQHPKLKVVLLESGVTWLPGFLWRLQKTWKGVRFETPWVTRPPAEILRDQIRLTVQPLDAPEAEVERALGHLRSDDMLLWASDWPHWQFDGDEAIPPGLPERLLPKILRENALATYARLHEGALA
ncbi:amidohydrolase [Siccirubricoccus sp. KC 17139]|uniref:Amidohydrolase n=1 Tax=Siccirubricoccus soli TaxID=2899147 RepID=A0ABT1D0J8_9PROT|nr:amidohydrolase family protein [Siccirubricoccus soli]MCO6415441.1 amidohydrolase [Siccirubricoccus soli]MCP2681573.1 amidohydrolase [Siccirubricoccus soli]